MDILAGMRVFTAVVAAGSFASAADKLEFSRGMATRYVNQLEAHLGVRLLNRTTAPLAAATTNVSPALGLPMANSPCHAARPVVPRTPSLRFSHHERP